MERPLRISLPRLVTVSIEILGLPNLVQCTKPLVMITVATDAFRAGRFREAALVMEPSGNAENQVLRLEIDYFLGLGNNVRENGPRILRNVTDPKLASRSASILASQLSDDGAFAASLEMSQKAVDFAQRSTDLAQLSAALCALLERTC